MQGLLRGLNEVRGECNAISLVLATQPSTGADSLLILWLKGQQVQVSLNQSSSPSKKYPT